MHMPWLSAGSGHHGCARHHRSKVCAQCCITYEHHMCKASPQDLIGRDPSGPLSLYAHTCAPASVVRPQAHSYLYAHSIVRGPILACKFTFVCMLALANNVSYIGRVGQFCMPIPYARSPPSGCAPTARAAGTCTAVVCVPP
eukprot:scaffold190071_cov25-Tisochrysis_lutea.AAC.1